MTGLLALIALASLQAGPRLPLPCVFWSRAADETLALVKDAQIASLCVPPELVDGWRAAGVDAVPLSAADLAARTALPAPGIEHRPDLVSATRSPWLAANGWRLLRHPEGQYRYDGRPAAAALAAAEAFAYGGNAVLSVDSPDLAEVGRMLSFIHELPPTAAQAPRADFGLVDDGSEEMGEVMNLLVRRNLLFELLKAPSSRYRINVVAGAKGYAPADMADPSEFALRIRHQLTDAARTLRIFGTEVVICRATSDAAGMRLHLLNYGAREIQGLRVRVRGRYREHDAQVFGSGHSRLDAFIVTGGATEFSIPRMSTYAVLDLTRLR
jgi:hypothetical protein